MRSIFFNPRRLRPGWRLLLFIALLFVLMEVFTLPVSLLWPELAEPALSATDTRALLLDGYFLLPLLLASWLMARYIDRRPFASLGLNPRKPWAKEFLTGAGLGLAMGAAYLGASALLGGVSLRLGSTSTRELALLILGFLLAAGFEETLFHGYGFQTLIEGLGAYPALFLISVFFSLAHRSNPGISLVGLINIGLAGLLLALGYLRTRALGLPIGIHFAWNLFQIVFSLPVSGLAFASGPLRAELRGDPLLTGGGFGPEGGLIATAVFAGAVAFLALSRQIRPSPLSEALWKEHLHPPSSRGLEL
ncbi:MAG: CPBP family intramembrane metalloprotease [Candidatus Acetothermia bacterium]|nr:CPBP family intramembrane metalloprotease [Candidatus Acetothermia bacterium]MDH7504591.1 CPBP family intramembrane metalloprotease [Candidatus Acetothermia bacterium]